MDVKVGSGAFATSIEAAIDLTESLLAVAEGAGLRVSALLTDMSQVLGRHVGNALEVREAIAALTGRQRDERLDTVTMALAGEASRTRRAGLTSSRLLDASVQTPSGKPRVEKLSGMITT